MRFYEYPTQVAFLIAGEDGNIERSAGIAYKDEIICGCCGCVFGLNEILEITDEYTWINFIEEIGEGPFGLLSDDEKDFYGY
jgi:hypothetical protein